MRPNVKFLDHVSCNDPIAAKYHFANPKGREFLFPIKNTFEDISKSKALIYIQREPLDNLISMLNNELWREGSEKKNIYSADCPEGYFRHKVQAGADGAYDNLKFFNNFQGPKLMIMYEMLVYGDYRYPIEQLHKLIGGPEENYQRLINNFEKYRKDSMEAPHRPPLTLKSYSGKKDIVKNGHRGPLAHRLNLSGLHPANYERFSAAISPMLENPLIQNLYGPLIKSYVLGTSTVSS